MNWRAWFLQGFYLNWWPSPDNEVKGPLIYDYELRRFSMTLDKTSSRIQRRPRKHADSNGPASEFDLVYSPSNGHSRDRICGGGYRKVVWSMNSSKYALWHKPGAITNRPQTTSFNHLFRWEHDIADNGMTGQMWKMPTVTWLRVSWHLSNTFPRSNSRGSQDISREELMNLPFHSSLTRATFWSPEVPSKDRDETRFWARWWWWWWCNL